MGMQQAYTGGPRLTRKTGPGKTPCYAKSRCARLLLCSKCPSESTKPRETEELVLGEVTTVQCLSQLLYVHSKNLFLTMIMTHINNKKACHLFRLVLVLREAHLPSHQVYILAEINPLRNFLSSWSFFQSIRKLNTRPVNWHFNMHFSAYDFYDAIKYQY